MKKNIHNKQKRSSGFTLLEVMIAIAIFGFLMLYVSQFMRSEIHVFNSVSRQNDIEQKARVATMHILDEVRLNNFTFFDDGQASREPGIYRYTDQTKTNITCLVNLRPSSPQPDAKIFYDYNALKNEGELWYQKDGFKYLIADEIAQLSITQDPRDIHLVKIDITVGGQDSSNPYELVTWVRLY